MTSASYETIGNICTTLRDVNLILFLFEQKGATASQINRSIFCGASRQVLYRRLDLLCKAGLIERSATYRKGRSLTVYHVTPRAFHRYVKNQAYLESVNREQLKSDSIDHDIALTEIRLRMQLLEGVLDFYTENRLQTEGELEHEDRLREPIQYIRSDAVIRYVRTEDNKEFFLPIEYEASFKSKDRCLEKVQRYHVNQLPVLWICSTANLLDRFRKIEKEYAENGDYRLHFALLEDVLLSKPEIRFSRADDRVVVFRNRKSLEIEMPKPGADSWVQQ